MLKHHTNVPYVIAYSSKMFLMLHHVSGKRYIYIDSRPYKIRVKECTVKCDGGRVDRNNEGVSEYVPTGLGAGGRRVEDIFFSGEGTTTVFH